MDDLDRLVTSLNFHPTLFVRFQCGRWPATGAASHLFSYRRIFAGVTAQRESLSERVLVVPEPLLPVLEPLLFVPEPVVPRSVSLPVVLEPLLPVPEPEVPMP